MSSNTEQTEARLAAYIDGLLEPAERAEIEKYLAANPQHQKLLADMTAQRQLLRSLPRDKAPSEIYDAIQAQLERSILLEDPGHTATAPVRHSRRSQLVGLAAVLTLAVGLGAVLYFALPTSHLTPTEIAMTPRPSTGAAATSPAEETRELGLTGDLATLPVETGTTVNTETGPVPADRLISAHPRFGGTEGTATAPVGAPAVGGVALAETTPPPAPVDLSVASNFAPITPTARALADAREYKELASQIHPVVGPAAQDRLVVLVSTDTPADASKQVAAYLESNKIRWEPIDPGAPQAQAFDAGAAQVLRTKDAFYRQRQVQQEQNVRSQAQQPEGEVGQPVNERDQVAGTTNGTLKSENRPASPVTGDGLVSGTTSLSGGRPALKDAKDNQLGLSQPATDQPVQSLPPAQQQVALQYFSNNEPTPRYIVARGMTRRQATELTNRLSTPARPTQRARLLVETPSLENNDLSKSFSPARKIDDSVLFTLQPPQPTAESQARADVDKSASSDATTDEEAAKSEPTSPAPASPATSGAVATTAPLASTLPTTVPTTNESLEVVILVEGDVVPTTAESATTSPASAPQPDAATPPEK